MATADLLGYSDRLSVRAGERVRFMVSCEQPTYRAEIVRMNRGSAAPGALSEAELIAAIGQMGGRYQHSHPGSCVCVETSELLRLSRGLTIQLWMQPTLLGDDRGQCIVNHQPDNAASRGWTLDLDNEGHLHFQVGGEAIATTAPLRGDGSWYFVAATFDAATGAARLRYDQLRPSWLPAATERLAATWPSNALNPFGEHEALADFLGIGAACLKSSHTGQMIASGAFNGKIDRPRLWGRALSEAELDALAAGADPLAFAVDLIAAWDFSQEIGTVTVRDTSPNRLDGRTLNAPMRGVTGYNWDGSATSFHVKPEHYGAIAFHADDLEDCGWEADFSFDVPADLPSGLYAARLSAGEEREEIPFYVRPAVRAATAPILFLAPTNTYLAYANERLYDQPAVAHLLVTTDAEIQTWPWEEVLNAHPALGASCYDRHPDGGGVSFSSRLRPIVTMRSDYVAFTTNCTRHFSSDLSLIEWLERLGFPYDVATDEDLHLEGQTLLARYKVVVTGSHPEYWTEPMLDALAGYLAGGGRLMYLGGNGFYWVTGIDPARPHLIEIRRGIAGTRTWESAFGEYDLSLTGEPGGLWRFRGRDPRRLTGVGFASEGWCGAPGYVRLPDSFRPEAAFIFEGVGEEETIGEFGFVMGGAAGDEVDRYDLALGTPPETLRLATTEGRHSDCYQLVIEDTTYAAPGRGGTEEPLVRADLTYLPLPNGGAVFSVGSINWSGSLLWNEAENNVSRITGNVLRRFAEVDEIAEPRR